MDQQWQPYSDMGGKRQSRYSHSTPQQQLREFDDGGGIRQQQAAFTHGSYQTPTIPSYSQSMMTSPAGTPHSKVYTGDGDRDIAMEDADPYNTMKYPSRPNHHRGGSTQYLSQEDSVAARRYSPMKPFSSASYYPNSPQHSAHGSFSTHTQSVSARQSPTRQNSHPTIYQNSYSTPSKSVYLWQVPFARVLIIYIDTASSRRLPPHLPPIQPGDPGLEPYYPNSATAQLNAVFGREARSPGYLQPPRQGGLPGMPRGPVPRFKKLDAIHNLQPRINPQPAFRRANPEGGFISVSFHLLYLVTADL